MRTILLVASLSLCQAGVCQQWLEVTPVPRLGSTTADPAHGRIVTCVDTSATVFEWDGAAWSPAVPYPVGRDQPTVCYEATSRKVVSVFDGPSGRETWLLDDRTWTQLSVSTPAVARLVVDPSNGGLLGVEGYQYMQVSWDGVQWQTVALAASPDLSGCGLVADTQRQCVLAFGGWPFGVPISNDTWQWQSAAWQLLQPAHRPPPRVAPAMTLDLISGNVMLYGGNASTTQLHDTWIWNGTDWLATAPTLVPDVANRVHLEFDRTRNAVLLFGADANGDAHGYQWTGTDWVALPDCETPALVAVTEDLGRGRIVGLAWNGTSEYDGFRWSRPVPYGPTPRGFTPLANFPVAGQTLWFGAGSQPLGETWTWNGAYWSLHYQAPQPPARSNHGLAWHPGSNGVVMFGGSSATGVLGDTWLWNGTSWQDLTASLPVSPPAGGGAGLGLDLPTGELLMLDPNLTGTWAWNGSWQNRATNTVPGPQFNGLKASHDPSSLHLLITGHFGPVGISQAWRWTGTDWQLAGTPPSDLLPAVDLQLSQWMLFGEQYFVQTSAPATVSRSGTGCGSPPPRIDRFDDRPQLGRTGFGLRLVDVPPAAPVAFAVDLAAAATPLSGGCTLLLANPQTLAFTVANVNGHAQTSLGVPMRSALLGLTLYGQGVAIAAPGPLYGALRLSDRLTLTVGF
jgi:hypothetical protein